MITTELYIIKYVMLRECGLEHVGSLLQGKGSLCKDDEELHGIGVSWWWFCNDQYRSVVSPSQCQIDNYNCPG